MEPRCIWNLLTGTYCPGCGMWRAGKALLAGDLAGAFMYNPFLFLIVIPLIAYMAVIYLRRLITKTRAPSVLSSPKAIWPVAAAVAGVWVFRNVFPLGLSG